MNAARKEMIKVFMQTSDDTDDEIVNILAKKQNLIASLLSTVALATQTYETSKRNCIRNFVEEVIPTYTEKEFITHFRIKRSLFEDLFSRFEGSDMYPKLGTAKKCSARKCTAMFLWFAGHEACCFRDVADRFDLSLSSVSRIIERYTMFLSNLSPSTIKWPNEEEKLQTSEFFRKKAGFSKVIGCIDGTHVRIDPPKNRKDDYIDRKGNITLVVQAICNEQKKFIDVFIGYPGSSHDSWVYRNSNVAEKIPGLGDYYILGDSAYPCSANLITPYRDNGHLTSEQKMFNVRLSSCRVAIEHSFGILKQRFRQLYYCKLRGMPKICHFIRACCVLHNIANEDDLDFVLETVPETETVMVPLRETTNGDTMRGRIMATLRNT